MQAYTPPAMKLEGDPEKAFVEAHQENLVAPCSSSKEETSLQSFDTIDEKRLMRRIDFVIIPWPAVLYLWSVSDRMSIDSARRYTLYADLGMSDKQYRIIQSLFFVAFALLEVPSNLCLKVFKPSIWLPTITVLWGLATVFSGLVENFAGLLALRIVFGVFVSGLLPGVLYYLTCWYKRDEIGFRLGIFTGAVTFSSVFGDLIATAVANMDGLGGKPNWAWIFIMPGIITVVVGLICYFLLQDFPDSAHFLSERERLFVIRRLQSDGQMSAGGEKLVWRNVWKSFTDYKTWLGAMCLIGFGGPMYAFVQSMPSIIMQIGFIGPKGNLMAVPFYFLGSVFTCAIGYLGDRLGRRGYINIALNIITGASYIILLCSRQVALSYFALFIAALGIFPGTANVIAWLSNNIEGSYKRGSAIAIALTCSNLTGIIDIYTYQLGNAPWYTLGDAITLGYVVIGFIGSISMIFLLRKENERRNRGERDEVISNSMGGHPRNGCYESPEAAKLDKGDEWSGYRYIL